MEQFFLGTPNQITKVHAHQTHFCDKSLFDVWAFEKIAKVNEGVRLDVRT